MQFSCGPFEGRTTVSGSSCEVPAVSNLDHAGALMQDGALRQPAGERSLGFKASYWALGYCGGMSFCLGPNRAWDLRSKHDRPLHAMSVPSLPRVDRVSGKRSLLGQCQPSTDSPGTQACAVTENNCGKATSRD